VHLGAAEPPRLDSELLRRSEEEDDLHWSRGRIGTWPVAGLVLGFGQVGCGQVRSLPFFFIILLLFIFVFLVRVLNS
jgi:hypothetical protein